MALELELRPHEKLFLHRRRLGKTQTDMAIILGVSGDQLCAWECGKGSNYIPSILVSIIKPTDVEVCIIKRRREGMLQKDLAEKLKCSRNWINRMEQGLENPEKLIQFWS